MPRPYIPRANWRYFTSSEFISYSSDEENAIISALKSVSEGSFNQGDRDNLLTSVNDSAWSFQAEVHLRSGPRRNEVIASLENIAATATSLSKSLREIDDMSLAALMMRGGNVAKCLNKSQENGLSREEAIESLLGIIPNIGEEAKAALERMNNPSYISAEEFLATPAGASSDPRGVLTGEGNTTENAIQLMAGNLGVIFEDFTGVSPKWYWDDYQNMHTGNFFEFAEACIRPITIDLESSTLNDYLSKGLTLSRRTLREVQELTDQFSDPKA